MYLVSFRKESTKRKNYKTLNGAYRAIWTWLNQNAECGYCSASIMGPGLQPATHFSVDTVPYKVKDKTDFLQTKEWAILRHQAFAKYGNQCACCGIGPEQGAILHVDHIKPRSLYPELESCIDNLQILCQLCNVGKSNVSEMKWR